MHLHRVMTDIATHPQYVVGTWALDPAHSEVSFTVRHLAISKVRGTFEKFDVTAVTGATPEESTVEATIDMLSVNTNQADRDKHLRTNDFFNMDEFPTMTFKSTGITVDGEDFTVAGDLTLRGITKPVKLKGEFGGFITDGYGQQKAGATLSTKINRKDFEVNWNSVIDGAGGLMLGDDVTINLEIALVLQK
ncbi:MAG: polyisoprenoid-binding protein [Glaciihabitans sp.]|jgi:polyisoprenoid-binding protein YceI|nr:polyisoprenoid-binding protein [Glaciihabitans sp.]